jgi:predicted Zn-dependent peptidase
VLALVAASILSLAASGDPARLDNGATLIVEPVPGCGAVSVIASYATGFADDPPGLAQAAHLAEHLRVTAALGNDDPGASAARLNQLGAANAETLATMTYYDFALPPEHLALAFRTEAARLTALTITPGDIEREIPRVRAEVDSVASSPGVFVGKFAAMAAAQVWLHGADRAAVRVPEPPNPQTMRAFIDDHHRADALTLIVTGDVDPAEAEALFREHLGALPRPPARAPALPPDFSQLPAIQRVAWDMPAKVVLIALPTDDTGAGPYLEALAARATFALNQKEPVRSTVSSGPTVPIDRLPLFVGVCLHPDADEERALALLHDALDAAAQTPAAQIRQTALFLATPQPTPDARTIRAIAERTAAQRGLSPTVATGMIIGNHALQSLLRTPPPDIDDAALEDAVHRAFDAGNRRVLVLTPG